MKKPALLAAALLLVPTHSALADDCGDRIARLMLGSLEVRPSRGHLVSEPKGGTASENEMLFAAWDHYLNKPIDPPGPWVLTYDGAMYQSSDEGATWSKFQSFDKEATRAQNRVMVTAQSNTVRNAVCGEEELDGATVATFEADVTNPEPYPFEIHAKYWVDLATGFVVRSTSHMVSPDFESLVTQTWTLDDSLVLPVPE